MGSILNFAGSGLLRSLTWRQEQSREGGKGYLLASYPAKDPQLPPIPPHARRNQWVWFSASAGRCKEVTLGLAPAADVTTHVGGKPFLNGRNSILPRTGRKTTNSPLSLKVNKKSANPIRQSQYPCCCHYHEIMYVSDLYLHVAISPKRNAMVSTTLQRTAATTFVLTPGRPLISHNI